MMKCWPPCEQKNRMMCYNSFTHLPKVKLYNREIGGLLKGAATTGCTNLILIMMSGEEGDIEINGLIIHKVLAIRWLIS